MTRRRTRTIAGIIGIATIAVLVVGGLTGGLGASRAGAQAREPRRAQAVDAGGAETLDCRSGGLSRADTIVQLRQVRASIDRSLRLLDSGERQAAFAEARAGYLQCFEAVEAPLDVVAGVQFRFAVEDAFSRVRGLINSGASTDEVRDRVVTLRGRIDETERRLSSAGIGAPLLVFGQSFSLLLREGLEAVLLLAALLGYLESAGGQRDHRRPILYGVLAAVVATVLTYVALDAVFAVLPFGREVLEAVVGLLAVAVLFYVSFWLVSRLEQRRWLEFLRARTWRAAAVGSAMSLALIGFTSVYREGLETALFYQAMLSFTSGLHVWVWLGVAAAAVALAFIAWAVLRLGRTLPVRTFLTVALVVVMATSVALAGNAMRALQEAAVIDVHLLHGWPSLPIYLAEATGYYPTLPSVAAQVLLTAVYALGATYLLVIMPRRRRTEEATADSMAHSHG